MGKLLDNRGKALRPSAATLPAAATSPAWNSLIDKTLANIQAQDQSHAGSRTCGRLIAKAVMDSMIVRLPLNGAGT